MNYFGLLMEFLRDRHQFIEDTIKGKNLERNSLAFLVCSCLFFALYGGIIGSFNGGLQILVSGIKLPALYLLTLFICLPSLFFFDVVSGSKRTFLQYLALLMASMAAISVMLFGFAPITLFFRLSTNDYLFFVLLNIIILGISSVIGIQFFYRGMLSLSDETATKPQQRLIIIRVWLFLYAFVGSQLAWTLRPFFGMPGEPVQIFRDLESNFYLQVVRLLSSLLQL